MGFRFSKSFRLPGGFRFNVSKSGVGVSAGIPGFRVGVGPQGGRVTTSIPGTGVSWTKSFALGGPTRAERPARAEQRKLAEAERDQGRMAEQQRSAHEVASFENRLARLTSLHKEAWSTWDWQHVAAAPPPPSPEPTRAREIAAAQALAAYVPTAMDKMLGTAEGKRADLEARVERAKQEDAAEHQSILEARAPEMERWQWYHRIARGVLQGDVEACQTVIRYLGPFAELEELGTNLDVTIERAWCVEAWFCAQSADVVPSEAMSLTPTGKLSRKKMPATRYWALYQDHVCSAAVRIAREIFALLPVPVVFVHAAIPRTNTATGHPEATPVLSVAFEREPFLALRFDDIDPSDAVSAFEHAMNFKKTTGFSPIELLRPEDAKVE